MSWLIVTTFGTSTEALGQQSFQIDIVEGETSKPTAARMEFLKTGKRSPHPRKSLIQGNQILVEDSVQFRPAPGEYDFVLRKGPEFEEIRGSFSIEKKANDAEEITLRRKSHLRQKGWHSGDLLTLIPEGHLARWKAADDLDVVSSSVDHAYWDRRPGSGLLLHGWSPPAQVPLHVPSSKLLEMAAKERSIKDPQGSHFASMCEIQSVGARDVPLWLASGHVDAVQILSQHIRPHDSLAFNAELRNPDPVRFSGKKGLARSSEYIYWQMLEAGLHLPPSAGSGFGGDVETWLGYNRVYVLMPKLGNLTQTSETDLIQRTNCWWQGLRVGNSFVTNGPLLQTSINGYPPGTVFDSNQGTPVELNIDIELTVRDPVDYLDVIFNGKTLYQAKLEDHARRGKFPLLSVDESGWMVIRVICAHQESYRLASTAPYYFRFDNQTRIDLDAVKFFIDWLEDSVHQIKTKEKRPELYEPFIEAARNYWNLQLKNATSK